MSHVSIQIVTFDSADDIGPCLESIRRQTHSDFRIRILDNASTDGTLDAIRNVSADADLIRSETNIGFAAAHNRLAREYPAPYILFLNPDTVIEPTFLSELAGFMDRNDAAGSVAGKLLRMDGKTLDSTGIVMTRNQRHLDRGAEREDTGQYDETEEVFGVSAAAALYRYGCLEDVAIGAMFFDEDFFAYREDADLAWRCRLRGWKSFYLPQAVARHGRRVTPERRSSLSKAINRHSVKNRFLLRMNNMTPGLYRRFFFDITARDLAVVGYVLLNEWSSLPALWYVFGHWGALWEKREMIQSRIRVSDESIAAWFGGGLVE